MLTLMSIESELLSKIDVNSIIDDIAHVKARKHNMLRKQLYQHYTNRVRKATRLTGVVVSLSDIYSSLLSINAYYFDNIVATC